MLAKGQITVSNLDDGKTPFLYQAYKMKDGRFLKHYPVYEASPVNGYKKGDLWHRTDGSQPGYFVANKSNTTLNLNDWTFYANELAYSDTDKFYPKFEGTYSDYNEVASDDQTKYTWKIIKADDGIGIKSVKEYYAVSASNVTPPSLQRDWSETPKPTNTTNKYLWNYEVYTYSNGDARETTKRVIGTHGATGATGNGIVSVTNYYLATTLGTGVTGETTATQQWKPEVQKTDPVNKYLWNYEKILYTNGSNIPTTPVIIGTHGEKGDKGDNAPLVKLSGATQIITQSSTGARTPSTNFTVVGTSVNTTISAWTYSVNGGTFGTGLPTGVARSGNTVTIAPGSITFNTLSIKATGGGVSDTFTIARIVDGEKGAKGDPGSTGGTGSAGKDAYTVLLSNESHTFQAGTTNAVAGSTTTDIHAYKGTNKVAVTVGTIRGMPEGMTGTVINNGKVNARITFTVDTKMTSPSGVVTIPLTVDGKIFNKEFSYALTFKGHNAVVGLLTNESITLPANKDGLVSNFTGANGVFDIYDGITKKTRTGTAYSIVGQPTNITVDIHATTGVYKVTAMPTGTTILNGHATFKAIYNGVTIEKQLNVAKSLTGATGATGATGPQGATGSRGPVGATGVGVSSVTEYYLATSESSGIKDTDKRFTTAMQPMTADKKYLWNYEKINFSNNTSQPTIPVIIGVYGDKGQPGGTGATGRSITSITEHYLATSAKTGVTRSTSGWKTSMQPTTETNKYLWNYETINWSSGTTPTYVEPIIIGVHGDKGASATSYWITASNNIIGKSQTGVINPTTITFKGFSKTGTANSVAYSGRFIIQTSTNGTTYTTGYTTPSNTNEKTKTYTIPSNALFVKCLFYMAGGTTILLDEQTVPIVESAEGIEVGGENLLLNTSFNKGTTASWNINGSVKGSIDSTNQFEGVNSLKLVFTASGAPSGGITRLFQHNSTGAGNYFMMTSSAYVKADKEVVVGLRNGSSVVKRTTIGTSWQKISQTEIGDKLLLWAESACTLWVAKPKTEKGTVATDWTPAPEDARTYKAWANSSDGTADFTRVYPNENLLLESNQLTTNSTYAMKDYPLADDTLTATDDVVITLKGALGSDRVRFYAYNSGGSSAIGQLTSLGDGIYQYKGKWNPNGGNSYLRIYQANSTGTSESTIEWIKLERGTTPTIYTTNTADSLSGSIPKYVGFSPIDSDVPHEYEWIMNPEYAQALADEALAGKVDNDAEYENLKNIAQEVKESYENFVGEDGEYKTEHSKLLDRTTTLETDLGEYREQINFVDTYMSAGNEGLIIGVKDSEGKPDANAMQMLLSNKSLSFMDGGEVVAYFSGQSFHINRGAIVESLQVGQHKITNLGNGHTVFQYTG